MSTEDDVRVIVEGMRQARAVFAQPALNAHSEGETVPGVDIQSDDDLAQFAREKGASIYHPVGVCKMGPDGDPTGRRRPTAQCPRPGRPARYRCIDHACRDNCQHKLDGHHDRRKGCGDDPGR